jgi:hypothetical protein
MAGKSSGGKDERFAVIRSLEWGTRQLRPGETLRLGRHHENDLVLKDPGVSRFHATVRWDKGQDRPALYDNGSQNGTNVDGKVVVGGAQPLKIKSKVIVGPYVLNVDLVGCEGPAAILSDEPDSVTLFSDQGPELRGALEKEDAVRQLFLRLECERRSGTLSLDLHGGKGRVTFGAGRVMDADYDGLTGLRALDRLVQAAGGSYRFSRELEPSDQAMNMWFSDFLRMKHDSYYSTRQWKRPATEGEPPTLSEGGPPPKG